MPIPGYTVPGGGGGAAAAAALHGARVTLGSLTLNWTDGDGCDWILGNIDGWVGTDLVGDLVQRPNADGAWDAPRYLTSKVMTLDGGWIIAPDPAALGRALSTLLRAVPARGLVTLTVEEDPPKRCAVKRAGRPAVTYVSDVAVQWSWIVEAPDPRRYATAVQRPWTTLPDNTGVGLVFPATFPVSWPAIAIGGTVAVVNDGDVDAPWTATVTGTGNGLEAGWGIRLGERGLTFDFAVPPGRAATIDVLNGLVSLDGAEYQGRVARGSTWFLLPPGVSVLQFTGTGTGRLDVTAASTWS